MMMEMHGGMDHFGVLVYSEGFREPFPGFKYGDRKLVDGLWYYDEDYHLNPDYDKVVEKMLWKYGQRGAGPDNGHSQSAMQGVADQQENPARH